MWGVTSLPMRIVDFPHEIGIILWLIGGSPEIEWLLKVGMVAIMP